MHRFYLPPDHCRGNALRLDGGEARHALRVVRLKHTELATVLDGVGNSFLCNIESVARGIVHMAVTLKNFTPPPPCPVTLLVAVPKGKIIEDVIQKSVELGASRVVPLLTERVVTRLDEQSREHKREQWQQVAIEAIKQCGAAWLPRIEAPVTVQEFLARGEKFDLALVGSLQTERRHPRAVFGEFQTANNRLPKSAAVWIGPEGDFTLDELKAIQNSGAQPITLGPLVLRVETAAIYCLSFLNYELNRPAV